MFVFLPQGTSSTKLPHKPDICAGCPAAGDPGPVPFEDNGRTLVIIGEAPGEQELAAGKPFIGPSGGLLWRYLSEVGVYRRDCYITNAAKCLTRSEGAYRYCYQHFLSKELEQLENIPKLVLGNEAKNVVMPELSNKGIMAVRGTRIGNTICAIHPTWIRRTIGKFASKGGDKQDLSPTLMWDARECLKAPPEPPKAYVEGPPQLVDAPFVSCDLETQGFDAFAGEIVQIGFGWGPGKVFRERYREDHRAIYQAMFDRYPVVFHNKLFDLWWLTYKGYRVPRAECSMLAAHLLTPDMPLSLEFQNSLYVHYKPWKGTARQNIELYHATDLDTTWQLWDRMKPMLEERGIWRIYDTVVRPVNLKCLEMKRHGIKVDRDKMFKLNVGLQLRVEQIDKVLCEKFPGVDWNSPKQLATLLYDVLKLPPKVHKKTGNITTDATALEELAKETGHPILKLLMHRRSFETMRTRYTEMVLDDNNYYHHDVSFTAATGRARGFMLTMQKGAIRSLFIADYPDWELLYADWSQVELWISAIVSGDKKMQEFLASGSFHAATASRFKGGPADKSNPYYNTAKFITHGVNFGRGDVSVSRDHDIPLADVRAFVKWLFNEFPTWNAWREDQFRQAYQQGRLTNRFGFTRYFWSGNIKGMSYSFEPQSCTAEMMKRVILSLWPELPQPARIVLPVHDALIVTYPKPMREEVTAVVREHMQQPWKELGGWGAECEIGYGDNWAEASA